MFLLQYTYTIYIYTITTIYYIFRDQNFGLNELAAVQDVRNDFNLQDIQEDPAASSKDRGEFVRIAMSSCFYI